MVSKYILRSIKTDFKILKEFKDILSMDIFSSFNINLTDLYFIHR